MTGHANVEPAGCRRHSFSHWSRMVRHPIPYLFATQTSQRAGASASEICWRGTSLSVIVLRGLGPG